MPSTSLKTIWISVRAINYSSQVLNTVITQINTLENAEVRLAQKSIMAASQSYRAGIMFTTMGNEMGGVSGQALSMASSLGFNSLAVFQIGRAMVLMLPIIKSFTGVMDILKNKAFLVGAAFAGFYMIFSILKDYIGVLPSLLIALVVVVVALGVALWFAAGGMNALSGGAAAMSGAAAMKAAAVQTSGAMALGGANALAQTSMLPQQQAGTRRMMETGPALIHSGEVVYNPSTGRPTQIQNELSGVLYNPSIGRPTEPNNIGNASSTTIIEQPIHIGEINTKSDIEDLDEKLKKSLRKVAKSRR